MSKNEYRDYSGKNILLLDGGARQVLAMIEGFHRLGCTVSVYCSSKLDVGYVSKYRDYAILRKFDLSDEEGIEKDIIDEISTGKYDLVVPMTDFPANILAKNKFFLEQYAHIYVNDPEIYKFACDKLNTMQVCMENNIP